jgi:hypothetical protein
VSQTWFRGPFGTCSSNSTVPIATTTTTMCCGGIGIRSTLWYHKNKASTSKLHTYPRDATSVADVVPIGTCSSNSTVPIVPPPPCAAVGLRTSDPLWYHKTRLSHPNYPHLSQGRNQCRRRGSGPIRHMQLKFYRSTIVPPPPPCAAVDWHFRSTPLVP